MSFVSKLDGILLLLVAIGLAGWSQTLRRRVESEPVDGAGIIVISLAIFFAFVAGCVLGTK